MRFLLLIKVDYWNLKNLKNLDRSVGSTIQKLKKMNVRIMKKFRHMFTAFLNMINQREKYPYLFMKRVVQV